jgi:hypothetical protein
VGWPNSFRVQQNSSNAGCRSSGFLSPTKLQVTALCIRSRRDGTAYNSEKRWEVGGGRRSHKPVLIRDYGPMWTKGTQRDGRMGLRRADARTAECSAEAERDGSD